MCRPNNEEQNAKTPPAQQANDPMQCVHDCACTPASHTSSNTVLWSLRAPASLKLDVYAQTLPASFAVRGNYPNPFRQTTPLVFDLPLPTLVTVELWM